MPAIVYYILMIVGLVGADQAVKLYLISLNQNFDVPVLGNLLHFTYSTNRGAAFGIFEGKTIFLIVVVVLLVAGCLAVLFSRRLKGRLPNISLSLIAAGGIGNLIDRVFRGYVVDFIYVKIINFAIFNIADSCVTIGVVLMCIYVLRADSGKKKPAAP